MPVRSQSATRSEAVQVEEDYKKEQKRRAKDKKIIVKKSPISEESGSKTSLKQKILFVVAIMKNLLDIRTPIVFDESICHYEVHARDQCLLPSRSSIHIQGKLTQEDENPLKDGTDSTYNAICFLFSEIRYELNAIEIDKCKNVGITSLMKAFLSINQNQLEFIASARWNGKNG